MKLRPAAASACLLVFAAAIHVAPVHAAPINGLVIIGDSLSDPGNNALAMGSTASVNVTLQSEITSNAFIPTYPYASSFQYSNGNVWAYQFATTLGLSSQVAGPVLGGGLGANYASGGAATGPLNSGSIPPNLLTQTASYISTLGSAQAPADSLYVVAGGGNNARDALAEIAGGADPTATITATAVQFAADIGSIVDSLQGKGAANIVVWDVPNMGLAPAIVASGPTAVTLGTMLAQSMNNALTNRLASDRRADLQHVRSGDSGERESRRLRLHQRERRLGGHSRGGSGAVFVLGRHPSNRGWARHPRPVDVHRGRARAFELPPRHRWPGAGLGGGPPSLDGAAPAIARPGDLTQRNRRPGHRRRAVGRGHPACQLFIPRVDCRHGRRLAESWLVSCP